MLGVLDVQQLLNDCKKEYEKHSNTQREIINDFVKFMGDFVTYFESKGTKRKNSNNVKNKISELQKKNNLTQSDVMASKLMVFNLRGIKCNIVDYSILQFIMGSILRGEQQKINPKSFEGNMRQVIEKYKI